jgi:hypothetical protein
MLSAAARVKFQAAQDSVLDLLGVPAIWTQTKPPGATKPTTVGFKTAGYKDEIIVNSYGIGAKIITVKVSDVAIIAKFDTLTIGAERYTIASVMPVHINGVHAYHKCIIKGG